MSEIKVSQMPEANNINDNDLLMIIQGGYNKKMPKELLGIPTKAHQINVGVDTDYRVNLLKTKNLCDVNNMKILGGYNDSGYVSSPNYLTLQFIKVKPSTTYTLTTNLDLTKYTALRIVDFNSNQTFIRRSSGIAYTTSNYTFITSNDAYYIALAFYTDSTASLTDITQAQVEEGSTATEYTPFIPNQINVDNEKYSDTINVGTTEDSRSRVNFLKSKNLLNCNSFTSYSSTNVTATPSYTDGKLNYINATKSASQSSTEFITIATFTFNYPTGNYLLSGCPTGGGNDTYSLYLVDNTTSQDVYPRNEGTPANVTLTNGHKYTLYLKMASTAVFSDKKFYPMLRKATDTNDTYEPYVVPSINVDNEEIYSDMFTMKTYYKTLENNAYVSPYGAYGSIDVPQADIDAYGTMISAFALNEASAPMPCFISNTTKKVILVSNSSNKQMSVVVTFCKFNVTKL